MEISTCALINHIVLNNTKKSKSSKYCENSNDLKHPTATPIITSMSIPTQVRDRKVVLGEICLSCDAAKLQMLYLI